MLPRVDPAAVRESLRGSLIVYLEHIADGNVLALAEYIQCPRSILQNWLDGATVPRLENLLRTARSLNVPASSFFAPSGPTPTNIAAAKVRWQAPQIAACLHPGLRSKFDKLF